MPVRSDGSLQRRRSTRPPGPRLTRSRVIALVLLALGLVATAVSLISLALS
ncbi:MAG: hypothetical protein L0H41_17180 [Microlunatus sp.]|nr:hypothetical protein [Microlunatus sp.]